MLKKRLRFSGMEFLFWATLAAGSFNVVFLRGRNLSNTTIGTIMALVACTNIFAQPLWGIVSDRIRSVKKVCVLCLACSGAVFFLLPFSKTVVLTCVMLMTFTLFSSPLSPLLDSWVIKGIAGEPRISYGSLRLLGSIGYAIMTFVYGKLIDSVSINIIFIAYLILALISILSIVRMESETLTGHRTLKEMKVGRLFRNYYFAAFVIFAFLIYIPTTASMTYLPNLVEQVGGSREQLGIMFSFRALTEIPVFLFGGYLIKRFRPERLLIFAGILYSLQQLVYLLSVKPWQAFAGQVLGGPSYSLFLLGMIHYVYMLAPEELKSTSQTVAASFSMGLSSVVASYAGGLLIDHAGIYWLYRIGVISNVLMVTLFILSFALGKRVLKQNKSVIGEESQNVQG